MSKSIREEGAEWRERALQTTHVTYLDAFLAGARAMQRRAKEIAETTRDFPFSPSNLDWSEGYARGYGVAGEIIASAIATIEVE